MATIDHLSSDLPLGEAWSDAAHGSPLFCSHFVAGFGSGNAIDSWPGMPAHRVAHEESLIPGVVSQGMHTSTHILQQYDELSTRGVGN